MAQNPIIEKLFAVGAHFGYSHSRRHPSTSKYIFGAKGGAELFDLEQTADALENALAYIKTLAAGRKTILFVGSKAEAREAVERAAQKIAQPYVSSRWIGGTITNFSEIKKRLARLAEINDMKEKGETAKFTKMERLLIDREAADLETMFGGLKGLTRTPDALFIIDPKQESGSVMEATQLSIPTIAVLNSDCDSTRVTYPIPANDASQRSVSFILEEVSRVYAENLAAPQAPAEPASPQA